MAKAKERFHVSKSLAGRLVPIDSVQPDPNNARRRTPENLAALRESFRRFGQARALLVYTFRESERPTVISGNGGWLVAKEAGWTHVAVDTFDGTPAEARAYAIADNRAAELSEWDRGVLALQAEAMRGTDLEELMRALELEEFEPEGDPVTEDRVPAEVEDHGVQAGDLFHMGEHRLVCGDAGDARVWHALLEEKERAACVFTDPPYGVSYTAASGRYEAIENDELRGDELVQFLINTLAGPMTRTRENAAWYVWHASSTREDFAFALKSLGLAEHQYLIWIKPGIVLGRADYQWGHEPCFYMSRDGTRPEFHGDRAQSTVWRFAARDLEGRRGIVVSPGVVVTDGAGAALYVTTSRPKKRTRHVRTPAGGELLLQPAVTGTTAWEVGRDSGAEHPTQKPVELVARALRNSTRAGEIVLDPFMRSGSTLMGAHATGRVARGCEINPRYVRVAISRWEKATGQLATHARAWP